MESIQELLDSGEILDLTKDEIELFIVIDDLLTQPL